MDCPTIKKNGYGHTINCEWHLAHVACLENPRLAFIIDIQTGKALEHIISLLHR
jgi:hypothetical protein